MDAPFDASGSGPAFSHQLASAKLSIITAASRSTSQVAGNSVIKALSRDVSLAGRDLTPFETASVISGDLAGSVSDLAEFDREVKGTHACRQF
jgi:hypothetical protein